MRSIGAPAGADVPQARWPTALPSLFTGLRISVIYAVIGAIFGEYVGATQGLGIWMQLSQNSFRTDLVFAAILLTAVVSLTPVRRLSGSSSGPWCRGRRRCAARRPTTRRPRARRARCVADGSSHPDEGGRRCRPSVDRRRDRSSSHRGLRPPHLALIGAASRGSSVAGSSAGATRTVESVRRDRLGQRRDRRARVPSGFVPSCSVAERIALRVRDDRVLIRGARRPLTRRSAQEDARDRRADHRLLPRGCLRPDEQLRRDRPRAARARPSGRVHRRGVVRGHARGQGLRGAADAARAAARGARGPRPVLDRLHPRHVARLPQADDRAARRLHRADVAGAHRRGEVRRTRA